jgi:hypothetical protein
VKPFSALSRTLAFLLALALLLGAVGPAAAQQTPTATITADENGHATFNISTGGSGTLPSMVGTDPAPGGRPNALFYSLVFGGGETSVTEGDVFVSDPSGAMTDVIRFEDTGPFGAVPQFAVYSLPIGTDLADRAGFPTAGFPPFSATALENAAGIISYTPGIFQPGFENGVTITYNLTSLDPATIPEPSTLTLLAAGLGLAGWWRRRRAVATA